MAKFIVSIPIAGSATFEVEALADDAKSLLVRTAKDVPSWDSAKTEVSKLLATASEVPGLSATLEVTRWERDRAIALLHMMDNQDARHPDVAEFLDMVTSWS